MARKPINVKRVKATLKPAKVNAAYSKARGNVGNELPYIKNPKTMSERAYNKSLYFASKGALHRQQGTQRQQNQIEGKVNQAKYNSFGNIAKGVAQMAAGPSITAGTSVTASNVSRNLADVAIANANSLINGGDQGDNKHNDVPDSKDTTGEDWYAPQDFTRG